MAISKRYTVSGEQVTDRTIGGFGALSSYEPLREEVREPAQDEIWPIRRAIWFCIGLSAVGWTAVVGLVVYFFSVRS